jgi:hypothetical protein
MGINVANGNYREEGERHRRLLRELTENKGLDSRCDHLKCTLFPPVSGEINKNSYICKEINGIKHLRKEKLKNKSIAEGM